VEDEVEPHAPDEPVPALPGRTLKRRLVMLFRVEWNMDIEADTPRKAAEIALEIQRDKNSTAVVFEVKEFDTDGDYVEVDLMVLEDDNDRT
jgi:hypothetical protein